MSADKDARLFEVNTVDAATAKRLLSSFAADGEITEFFRITKGGSTSNYKITLSTGSVYLLRIYPKENDHSGMELAAYSYASGLPINVPEIYFFDNSKTRLPNTCLLMKFIDGVTLRDHMASGSHAGTEIPISLSIGKSLALLHGRRYAETALLNPSDLSVSKPLGSMEQIFEIYLTGPAGKRLRKETKTGLHSLIREQENSLIQIDHENVLSHGDFNFSNIIIDREGAPWFIDFEYCFSAPRYYDIGKFFRTSDQFDKSVLRDSFIRGYKSLCPEPLPENWWALSKFTEIQTLLALMSKEKLPEGWADEIEKEIVKNMDIVLNV